MSSIAEEALRQAAETIDNIRDIWVSGQKAIVKDNQIVDHRVTTKVTFLVKGHRLNPCIVSR